MDYDISANIKRVKYNLKPFKYLKSSTARLFKFNINNLNKYYCLNGKKQNFNMLVFKNIKTKKNIEVEHKKMGSISF